VLVDGGSGNAIRCNSIYSHASGLGIELINGGNNRLPFPVLTAATSDGTTVTIIGLLQSTPGTAFTLDFFANPIVSSSGFGEGQQFLGTGTVTTSSHGTASFTIALDAVPPGQFVAATATDPNNNTSSFSNCLQVTAAPAPPGPGRRETSLDDTAGRELITSPYGSPRPEAETARLPSVLRGIPSPLERRMIDIFFSKRNQKALRSAVAVPTGFNDALLSKGASTTGK
jgi:hypothetical protein